MENCGVASVDPQSNLFALGVRESDFTRRRRISLRQSRHASPQILDNIEGRAAATCEVHSERGNGGTGDLGGRGIPRKANGARKSEVCADGASEAQ